MAAITGMIQSTIVIRNQIHTPVPPPALLKIAAAPSHESTGLELNIVILLRNYAVTVTAEIQDTKVYLFQLCLVQNSEVHRRRVEFHTF